MNGHRVTEFTPVLLFTCTILSVAPDRGTSPLIPPVMWDDLVPQTHAVGFKVMYVSDESRTWNGEGHAVPRPIRISLWYPASAHPHAPKMLYRQYVHYREESASFAGVNAALEKRNLDSFSRNVQGDEAVQKLLNMDTAAILDAMFADGRFPLVLYASGLNQSWQADNNVLCEYLASAGYVVAAVAGLGAKSIQQDIVPEDLKASVDDAEFATRGLKNIRQVDETKLATIGHSMGAVEAVLFAMRNRHVRAVVGFDGSYGVASLKRTLTQSDYYVAEMNTPLLDLRRQTDDIDLSATDSFKSDRFLLQLPGLLHADFTSFPFIALHVPMAVQGRTPETGARGPSPPLLLSYPHLMSYEVWRELPG